MNTPLYFSGRGRLKAAVFDADGNREAGFRWLGNVPSLTITPSVQTYEHTESHTGLDLVDIQMNYAPKLAVAFRLEQIDVDNLALIFWGERKELVGAAFTARELPTGVVAGLDYPVGTPGTTITAITDSAGTPATVPASAYKVNADGTITFNTVAGFTQPFKAAGTDGTVDYTGLMTEAGKSVALIFEGLNAMAGRKPVIVNLGRVALAPSGALELIGQMAAGGIDVSGTAMLDENAPATGLLAGYGSIAYVREA